MIRITLQINNSTDDIIAVKETLVMYCEKFGDVRIVNVENVELEQMRLGGST